MTVLIPTDATHELDGIFFRLPRCPDRSDGSMYRWSNEQAQWLLFKPGYALDVFRSEVQPVAFTRQY